jgi:hypothetical protein
MGRSALPSTDRSTVWLAHLDEAAEVLAASAEPCDPAIVKAFGDRLEMASMSGRRLIRRLRSYQSGPRKDLAMFRLLSILALVGSALRIIR